MQIGTAVDFRVEPHIAVTEKFRMRFDLEGGEIQVCACNVHLFAFMGFKIGMFAYRKCVQCGRERKRIVASSLFQLPVFAEGEFYETGFQKDLFCMCCRMKGAAKLVKYISLRSKISAGEVTRGPQGAAKTALRPIKGRVTSHFISSDRYAMIA